MNANQFLELASRKRDWIVAICVAGTEPLAPPGPKCIFPGSFNPIHAAHLEMARHASERLSIPVWHEISIENVEKETLDWAAVQLRMAQGFSHEGSAGLILTKAPTFESKSKLFPNSTFAVGADTIKRVNELRFYENQSHLEAVLASIKYQRCNFMVFGRSINNEFFSSDLDLHPALRELCQFIERSDFDVDISSRQLRARES